MSLTSIINRKEYQEIRDKFKTVFPRPNFNVNIDIVAPPSTTNNSSIIGTAFDYLLRFNLEQKYKTQVHSTGEWIADKAFDYIKGEILGNKSSKIAVGNKKKVFFDRKQLVDTLNYEYFDAKINHGEYLGNGILTDELIRSCLFLARLDVYYRSGMIDSNFGNENNLDVVDIRNIFNNINTEDFHVKKHCYINPHFGKASKLVQGADADIIIDDTLIDIKVTKDLKLEREHLNQIIGYYILSMISGINDDEKVKPIKNIGIYFARHGYLWKYPLSDFADEQTFQDFKDWFIIYVNQNLWSVKRPKLKKSVKGKNMIMKK